MRIVFMGTPEFAVASLKILFDHGYLIAGVITAPDKPAGRGRKVQQSAVKEFALQHDLPVLQPLNLKDPHFIAELTALKPDLQVVVAFRMLPEVVFSIPALGTFNLHGSLLPQYRGAAPINWAIMNGETETGVTTFFLNNEIDKGAILFSASLSIGERETAGELHDRMMALGAEQVLKTAVAIESRTASAATAVVQAIHADLKPAPKLYKADCEIDWTMNATTIYNKIRGLSPYPTSFTSLKGLILKVFAAELIADTDADELLKLEIQALNYQPGEVLSDGKTFLLFRAADGFLKLTDIQLENKKRMSTSDLLRGFSISQKE